MIKKSILFLIPTLGGGGAERVLVNLVNGLNSSKYDITVQTLFRGGVNTKYLSDTVRFKEGKIKQFKGNVAILKCFSPSILYRLLVADKYDIVVSYLEGPTARIVAGCPNEESRLISWIHVEQHTVKAASHSYRSVREAQFCNKKFDYTVCVAESVKEDYLELFPNTKNCIVLYNTNEDENIIKLSKESVNDVDFTSGINFVSVGRLTDAKGYDRLIEAHKQLLDEHLYHSIYILGTGEDKEKLLQKIQKMGVSATFHLLGFKDNPYKYISKANAFVCSSRREGFSTAITESLILGVPVVSTLCSGVLEQLGRNNEYGVVVSNNVDGIYGGMKRLLSRPELLDYYKAKSEERGKMFKKSETIKEVEKLFDKM